MGTPGIGLLVLANPGAKKSEESTWDGDDAEMDLCGVAQDYNDLVQYGKGVPKDVRVSAWSLCDPRLSKKNAMHRIQEFLKSKYRYYIIVYGGHGRRGSGNWIMDDGDISFDEVYTAYLTHTHIPQISSRCLLILDSCHSGRWVMEAAVKKVCLAVQSSVSEAKGAIGARNFSFSSAFLRLQDTHRFSGVARVKKPLAYCPLHARLPRIGGQIWTLVGEHRTQSRLYLQALYSRRIVCAVSKIEFDMEEFDPCVSSCSSAIQIPHERQVGPMVERILTGTHAGVGIVGSVRFAHSVRSISVRHIEVMQSFRRLRIGTRLVKEMIAAFPEVEEIRAAIQDREQHVIEFFHSLGFRQLGGTPTEHLFSRWLPENFIFVWNDPKYMMGALGLFWDTFQDLYGDLSPEELGLTSSIDRFLTDASEGERKLMQDEPCRYQWVVAVANERVVGLLIVDMGQGFTPLCEARSCYIRQMAVAADHQRQGLGYALVKQVARRFPFLQQINAVTRTVNKSSQVFMERIGCRRSDYEHGAYDPRRYIGYTLDFSNGADGF